MPHLCMSHATSTGTLLQTPPPLHTHTTQAQTHVPTGGSLIFLHHGSPSLYHQLGQTSLSLWAPGLAISSPGTAYTAYTPMLAMDGVGNQG
jgi:hypothetical protein